MERASVFADIEQRVMKRGTFNYSIVHTIDIMSLEQFEHERKFKFFRTFLEDISGQTNVSTYREWQQAKKFAKIECAECKREQEVSVLMFYISKPFLIAS